MAEEDKSQEKTHEPTQRKLEKAKRDGQIPRSRELSTAISMIAVAMIFFMSGHMILQSFVMMMKKLFNPSIDVMFNDSAMLYIFGQQILHIFYSILPLLAVLFLISFAAPMFLGGFNFSTKSIAFKVEKLSVLKGIKRMFSIKSFMELLKSLAKFFLITGVGILFIYFYMKQYIHLTDLKLETGIAEGAHLLIMIFFAIAIALLLIAAIDVPFQLWQHKEKLKMTQREVKDELKDSEGNPQLKSKLREMQQETSKRRSLEKVPAADVILVNPTEYSVAIKYDQNVDAAPIVISKGKGELALKIREIAEKESIPLFSAPPLTRALYYHAEIDQEIPYGLYVAVAKVLSFVYQLKRYNAGYAPKPENQFEMQIPDELKHD